MKIRDLVSNNEFSFNVPFRIVEVGDIVDDDVELTVVQS